MIRRALQAGYGMRSMLLSAKWVDALSDVIDAADTPVYVVTPALAEQVTGYHVHRGALASMRREPLPEAGELLRTARRVAVMESVNDHTNIGAIFRSAAALGMDAVLLSPDCADPLYRRSVKVSMGAVFSVPYARLDDWPRDLDAVREAGFRLLALTPDARATTMDEAAPHRLDRVALMLGAEGSGLTARPCGRRTPGSGSRWPTGWTRSTSVRPPQWPSTRSRRAARRPDPFPAPHRHRAGAPGAR